MENNYCFVTGKFIPVGEPCRFTFEFDAWVSEEGQRKVYASSSDADGDLYLIRKEWDEQDDGTWIFWDETWANWHGPFNTEEFCRKNLKEYARELEEYGEEE